jgi:Astacin (Peptidase family M12A)
MAARRRSKKAGLRICFDRIIPYGEDKIKAAELAVKANPANAPKIPATLAGVSMHRAKIALFTGKKWANGSELSIAFLDGSKIQRQRVQEHAVQWMKYANLTFNFNGGKNSQIRISFAADDGSWSYIGADNLTIAKDEPTMNFGWLEDDSDDTEYNRVVVHEFGHALGAIHEHQNPKAGIKWNLPMVYKVFSGPPNNWSKEEIDLNIVQKYSLDQLNATKFDRLSIMLYSFPPELVMGGVGTPQNTALSTGDRRFIKKMYPKPKA